MKDLIFYLAFPLFFMPIILTGQSKSLGVIGGVNFNNTLIKNFDTPDPELLLVNFAGGLTCDFEIADHWFLRSGLIYETKGFEREFYRTDNFGNKVGGALTTAMKFNYLTLPVLFNWQTGAKTRFYAGTGPYLSYLIKQTFIGPYFNQQPNIPSYEWPVIGEIRQSSTENFKNLDFGLTCQTGIKYPITDNLLFDIGFNISHSLISVTDKNIFEEVKYYNRSFSIMFGAKYFW